MNKKMKISFITLLLLILLITVTFLLANNGRMNRRNMMMGNMNNDNINMMGNMMNNNRMNSHNTPYKIREINQQRRQLLIPEILEEENVDGNTESYSVAAQEGTKQFFDNRESKTLGYNGNYLGPVIKLKKGEKVKINTENKLKEGTTFHWHGLIVNSKNDGGPHHEISPGEKENVEFEVKNEASTLWFHPHAISTTASQVYNGLAGLIIVEDTNSERLKKNIPSSYGIDDFPLIVQDRFFNNKGEIDYKNNENPDGTGGDTLIINGTLNPYINVETKWVRLRIVNGSNASTFTYKLTNDDEFYQIASDGGFLNSPVEMKSLTLSAGERAEIIVDAEKINKKEYFLKINDYDALEIRVKKINRNVDFSKDVKLRENKFEVITEKEIYNLKKVPFVLSGMMHMVNINNKKFDTNRIDYSQSINEKEVWEVTNAGDHMGGMIHPFHIHGVQFRIISRNGKVPPENEQGWKDTVLLNPDETVQLLVQFTEKGVFMYHCHILEHEELGMMGQVEVQ